MVSEANQALGALASQLAALHDQAGEDYEAWKHQVLGPGEPPPAIDPSTTDDGTSLFSRPFGKGRQRRPSNRRTWTRFARESMRRYHELQISLADQPGGQHDAMAQFSVLQSILVSAQVTLAEAVHDLVHETTAVLGELADLVRDIEQLMTDLERCRSLVSAGGDPSLVGSTFDLAAMAAPWSALATSTAAAPEDLLRTPLRPASLRARATRRRD